MAGRGRGWRHWYHATGLPAWARSGWGGRWTGPPAYSGWTPAGDELNQLRDYAASLEEELSTIKARMAGLEKERPAPTAPEA